MKIKRLISVSVPIKNCNLKCHYCYIAALEKFETGKAVFKFSPEHVGRCLSKERLGGTCIVNLTGGGETLLPPEITEYIFYLLKEGHYLEVVTNGTLTKRFLEIASFPKEYLQRLEFKFSLHFLELKRLGLLDNFSNNVKLMYESGCSYTIECTPTDLLEPYIDELKDFCTRNFGANCHLTIARDDKNKMKILSDRHFEEYCKVWESFQSDMFEFKKKLFYKKQKGFCYAGCWSLYLDLGTGETKKCYGQIASQNIFKDINKPIDFSPVGYHCRQPYCYNGHAYLALGNIPKLKTPTYSQIRNRKRMDGSEWEYASIKEAFSAKLYESNEKWSASKKIAYELLYPIRMLRTVLYGHKEIRQKLWERINSD